VVAAVTEQISTLGHTSNLFITEPPLALAERLQELLEAPGARVLFANSGAEANEAAFKMARRTGRPKIIAAENAFHGRTMGALALTGQPGKKTPFEPMTPGVSHVPYGDAAALAAAVDADTAAVFLEPIMGEAGAVTPPAGYLAAAPRDHRPARRPARAGRGADRHRPHRVLVRLTRAAGSSRTSSTRPRAWARQPDRACIGLGAAGDCSNPASRHHVRRQPGLLRAAPSPVPGHDRQPTGLLEHVTLVRHHRPRPASRRWTTRWCAAWTGPAC
jgi:acetylornithine aminotransferase